MRRSRYPGWYPRAPRSDDPMQTAAGLDITHGECIEIPEVHDENGVDRDGRADRSRPQGNALLRDEVARREEATAQAQAGSGVTGAGSSRGLEEAPRGGVPGLPGRAKRLPRDGQGDRRGGSRAADRADKTRGALRGCRRGLVRAPRIREAGEAFDPGRLPEPPRPSA